MQRTALSQSVAWQEAMSLIGRVERATKSGSLGLRRQLQERAMSVAVGVALGDRLSKRGQAERGLRKAEWALMELEALLALGEELRYWTPTELQSLREQLGRMHRYLAQLESRLTASQ